MNVYKVTLYVKDIYDKFRDAEDLKQEILSSKNPSFKSISKIETKDIGGWSDSHPLNQVGTDEDAYWETLPAFPPKPRYIILGNSMNLFVIYDTVTKRSLDGFEFHTYNEALEAAKEN